MAAAESARWVRAGRVPGSAAAGLAALLFGVAPALGQNVEAQYTITLAGLTIGKAAISGQLSGSSYTLNVSSALTGLVGAVSRGQGSAAARGQIGGGTVLTNGFSFSASNGTDQRSVQIVASGGSVRSVVIEPPFDQKDDRVPVRPAHRNGVLDPVSALVMPSKAVDPLDKANCERRLPVFDGSQRFDIVLSYAGTQQVESEGGYSGPVLVCAARYVPVAGHRPNRRVTKFMIENRDMQAWLAPVKSGRLLLPYRISVRTMIGTTIIEATRFNPG
ncbi:MAG: DUF3108 domain-containing protein [Rhabdaerophilum calidifontis]